MEVVGEPPFSSFLRRVSSRCLSTFVFSLRGLSRLPSPLGSGWVSVLSFPTSGASTAGKVTLRCLVFEPADRLLITNSLLRLASPQIIALCLIFLFGKKKKKMKGKVAQQEKKKN